jgi:ketosteroid isomerase-like protein
VTRIGSSIGRQSSIIGYRHPALTVSEKNVDVVRRFYDAWAQDIYPGPVELMDPDIEYVNPPEAVEPGTRRGVPAFVEAVEKLLQSWEFWRTEIEEVRAIGDQVAVIVKYRTRGRGSGMDVEGRESALWTVRNGKVVRYQWFKGTEEALAAVSDQSSRFQPK